MCMDAANGMHFLATRGFVHCDLAARFEATCHTQLNSSNFLLLSCSNCFVSQDLTIKIGDFGMARRVDTNKMVIKEDGKLPVRWLAPESIVDGLFTSKGDVWSFGVVMWEVVTYAERPYGALSNSDVCVKVVNG